jgi:hypothetical protein
VVLRQYFSPFLETPVVRLTLEMKGLRARRRDRLLELDEVERRLKPFGRRYVGVREVPLNALVGTDGRASSVHP